MKNLQSPYVLPTPCTNPNLTTTSILQNFNHLPFQARNHNFITTSHLQNLNHILYSSQNLNFIETSTLEKPNHPLPLTQNSLFIATSTLENPNHPPCLIQNPNTNATSTLQDGCDELLPLPTTYNNTFNPSNPPLGDYESFKWNENDTFSLLGKQMFSYFMDNGNDHNFGLDVVSSPYDSIAHGCSTHHSHANNNDSKTCTPPQISPNTVNPNMSTTTSPKPTQSNNYYKDYI